MEALLKKNFNYHFQINRRVLRHLTCIFFGAYALVNCSQSTAQWLTKASLPAATKQHCAVSHPNGNIYVYDGWDGSATSNVLQIYNVASGTWSFGAPCPVSVRGAAYCLGTDENIYLLGGTNGFEYSNLCYKYNVTTNHWTAIAPCLIAFWEGSASSTCSNGKIYLTGGENSSSTLQIYNIAKNTWSYGANLPSPVLEHKVVTGPSGKELFLFGGYNSVVLSAVYKYSIASNQWIQVANMPVPLNQFGACLARDDNIYLVGGKQNYVNDEGPFFNTTYIFDPNTYVFTTGPSLPVALGENTLVAGHRGIYCMGGTNGTTLNSNYLLRIQRTSALSSNSPVAQATDVKVQGNISVQVSPNPNNGNFKVQMQLPAKQASTTLIIYGSSGKRIWQYDAGKINGSVVKTILLENKLSKGIYTLVVQRSDVTIKQQIVITK